MPQFSTLVSECPRSDDNNRDVLISLLAHCVNLKSAGRRLGFVLRLVGRDRDPLSISLSTVLPALLPLHGDNDKCHPQKSPSQGDDDDAPEPDAFYIFLLLLFLLRPCDGSLFFVVWRKPQFGWQMMIPSSFGPLASVLLEARPSKNALAPSVRANSNFTAKFRRARGPALPNAIREMLQMCVLHRSIVRVEGQRESGCVP